jgi:uncharacterized glyoxalase superfamily protein PhnB
MQNTDSRTTIIPGMQYRRAPEAIEGLCELYGFSKHAVYPGENNTIAHPELTFNAGMITLGSFDSSTEYLRRPRKTSGSNW